MRRSLFVPGLLLLPVLATGCAFHTTAEEWNGRVGADGKPIYFTSTTQVGANLLIIIPFLGRLAIDGMVEELTAEIRQKGGDHIQIVQGDSENYWYGFSPFTWIVSPVVSTLAAEYQPTEEQFRKDCATRRAKRIEDREMTAKVTGNVLYRERIAMPAKATIRLQLVQLFEPGELPAIIDDYGIFDPGNVPVPYELHYTPDDIDKTGNYAVQAEIHVEGKVMWKSTQEYKVITGGAPTTLDVVLTRVPDKEAGEAQQP